MYQGKPHIEKTPFISVKRDGDAVVVAFHGCPLRCQYCPTPQCWDAEGISYSLTPEELLALINEKWLASKDEAKGIVRFSGGEPALRQRFINRFRQIIPTEWRIQIETSLNVPPDNVRLLIPVVDKWTIDVKDMDMAVYEEYTGRNNLYVHRNLAMLAKANADCLMRLPFLPSYNTPDDLDKSSSILVALGFPKQERINPMALVKGIDREKKIGPAK